jgi:dihydrolipoamide dehydrogenase
LEKFDILILGVGPAGYTAAIRGAQLKKKVCLIEKNEVGGTCLNRGCIPTKSIITSANLFTSLKNSSEFGISVEKVTVNFHSVQERKRGVVKAGINGIRLLFKKHGITLEYGAARFVEPFLIEIQKKDNCTKLLEGDKIIIATGSCPANIPGVYADNNHIFDSDSILDIEDLPASLTIIGGGAVGCEFAHIFNSLGVKINLVEQLAHLIPSADEEISSILERELKKGGIKIHLNKKVEGISQVDDHVKIILSDDIEIDSEMLLVATGRRFNTEGFGIENTGIERGEKGEIAVNDRMETSISGIYAAGDVTGKGMLAYVASKEGIVAVENASGIDKKMDYSLIPSTVFTEPEIGYAGLSERNAAEKGINTVTGSFQFRALGRAHASGKISGMVKIVSDSENDRILGVHIIGAHASEIIHEAVIAMKMGIKSSELEDTIHSHPVYSEALMEGAADVHGRAIHKIN